jgi:glycosyltransferase involved in cell wall biosynthesis
MRIAILGTRGIPNNYGGFEQFAEYLSVGLSELGHEVYVYCPRNHPYGKSEWGKVKLVHIYDPEERMGTSGQFIYDLLCIIDSRKRDFDIILQLGYTSSSVWGRLLPSSATTVTNMDGLEWRRSKYSKSVQRFLKYAERLAIRTSDVLVADSKGIQGYLEREYHVQSVYIPYGTNIFSNPQPSALAKFSLEPFRYSMLIARMEPENNIETILTGVLNSRADQKFIVIGKTTSKYGEYLVKKFGTDPRICFLGSLYDIDALNNMRHYSLFYFHGHTVGGTNPSLLEAMGSGALICAHRNEFNHSILENDAFYFSGSADVTALLEQEIEKEAFAHYIRRNIEKIRSSFLWSNIISQYDNLFREARNKKGRPTR